MNNNLINKILEELGDINSEQSKNLRFAFFDVTEGADFEFDEKSFIFYDLGGKQELGLKLLLLTAFATLPYFDKDSNMVITNTDKTVKLNELLGITLFQNFTNPNWLEILEETYNQNV